MRTSYDMSRCTSSTKRQPLAKVTAPLLLEEPTFERAVVIALHQHMMHRCGGCCHRYSAACALPKLAQKSKRQMTRRRAQKPRWVLRTRHSSAPSAHIVLRPTTLVAALSSGSSSKRSASSSDDDDAADTDVASTVAQASGACTLKRGTQQSARDDPLAAMNRREAAAKAMGFESSSESEAEGYALDLKSLAAHPEGHWPPAQYVPAQARCRPGRAVGAPTPAPRRVPRQLLADSAVVSVLHTNVRELNFIALRLKAAEGGEPTVQLQGFTKIRDFQDAEAHTCTPRLAAGVRAGTRKPGRACTNRARGTGRRCRCSQRQVPAIGAARRHDIAARGLAKACAIAGDGNQVRHELSCIALRLVAAL